MEERIDEIGLNPLAMERMLGKAYVSKKRKRDIRYDPKHNPLPEYAIRFRGRLTGMFDDEELRIGPKYYKTGRGKKGKGAVINHVAHRKPHPWNRYDGF